jgi:hypothetical protein
MYIQCDNKKIIFAYLYVDDRFKVTQFETILLKRDGWRIWSPLVSERWKMGWKIWGPVACGGETWGCVPDMRQSWGVNTRPFCCRERESPGSRCEVSSPREKRVEWRFSRSPRRRLKGCFLSEVDWYGLVGEKKDGFRSGSFWQKHTSYHF